jgi:SAM-dependent methyltransferase
MFGKSQQKSPTHVDTASVPKPGTQSIYSPDGQTILFHGQWDSRNLLKAVTGSDHGYWRGRRVLDIGANTSGLSVEIARRGASVVAAEPDPYKNTRALAWNVLDTIVKEERLDLTFVDQGLFDAHTLGRFDTVMCLGLIYHFRDQQFVLDYLSTVDMQNLIVSCQTHPTKDLAMFNRMDPSISMPAGFWDNYAEPLSGWHPTRPMLERMLKYAGFDDVTPLTDSGINFPRHGPLKLTNSAYYRARKVRTVDPVESRKTYHPR